jgi:hypothetical protein
MGKRGTKPQGKVKIKWSSNFAYAIGLMVTDGCLYNDGRHMNLTTKDIQQAKNFKKCFDIDVKIGLKANGSSKEKIYHNVQFGDVKFYNFLISIGLSQAKSKTIGAIKIPDEYFFDYLRGSFDGDGTFYSYWDQRWRSSHMFYIEFISASKKHIDWLQKELNKKLDVYGHITKTTKKICYQLKYAKKEAVAIIEKMYYNPDVVCLSCKRKKIEKALKVESQQQEKYARV